MKRKLTNQQKLLLEMEQQGHSDFKIAAALGVSVKTVAKKRKAIKYGMSKGAYDITKELLHDKKQMCIFGDTK